MASHLERRRFVITRTRRRRFGFGGPLRHPALHQGRPEGEFIGGHLIDSARALPERQRPIQRTRRAHRAGVLPALRLPGERPGRVRPPVPAALGRELLPLRRIELLRICRSAGVKSRACRSTFPSRCTAVGRPLRSWLSTSRAMPKPATRASGQSRGGWRNVRGSRGGSASPSHESHPPGQRPHRQPRAGHRLLPQHHFPMVRAARRASPPLRITHHIQRPRIPHHPVTRPHIRDRAVPGEQTPLRRHLDTARVPRLRRALRLHRHPREGDRGGVVPVPLRRHRTGGVRALRRPLDHDRLRADHGNGRIMNASFHQPNNFSRPFTSSATVSLSVRDRLTRPHLRDPTHRLRPETLRVRRIHHRRIQHQRRQPIRHRHVKPCVYVTRTVSAHGR
jgi:hypothetical protein